MNVSVLACSMVQELNTVVCDRFVLAVCAGQSALWSFPVREYEATT